MAHVIPIKEVYRSWRSNVCIITTASLPSVETAIASSGWVASPQHTPWVRDGQPTNGVVRKYRDHLPWWRTYRVTRVQACVIIYPRTHPSASMWCASHLHRSRRSLSASAALTQHAGCTMSKYRQHDAVVLVLAGGCGCAVGEEGCTMPHWPHSYVHKIYAEYVQNICTQ